MIDWKDFTYYKKGQRGKIEPNILEAEIEGITVKIHRHIHYSKTWLLTCHDMNLQKEDLLTDDFKTAEKRAIKLLLNTLIKYEKLHNKLIKLVKLIN